MNRGDPLLPPAAAAIEPLLRRWIGLDVATVGPTAVQRAARARMEALGIARPEEYAARVAADEPERDALVEEVVVAESWFFRDPQVFDFVATFVATTAARPGRSPVRLLSAPCASGEEPYSLAMALLGDGLVPGQFAIDAIDVSHAALARAARGRYSANAFRNADLGFRDRWFTTTAGTAVIDDRVRTQVSFTWANILDESFAVGRGPYDVIFCRNLLIYLDAPARSRVEATLDALLRPEGLLVLGAAEPPILKGDWVPAGAASVFALRRRSATAGTPGVAAHGGSLARRAESRGWRPPGTAAGRGPWRPPDDVPGSRVRSGSVGSVEPAGAPPASCRDTGRTVRPPTDDEVAVLAEAGGLANAGRHAEALAICDEARDRLGPSPELFFMTGMLHQAAGDLDRAEGCFHKTLYLDATHDEALLALALLAERRGDHRMAAIYRQSASRAIARKGSS